MSKKALVIEINSKICDLIYEKLNEESKTINDINELLEAINGLKENEYNSLIINIDNNQAIESNRKNECNNMIISGKLSISIDKRSVYYDGKLIKLTPKEFDILYLLANNIGKIYTKKQIYSEVWKEEYSFDDSNIMAHIGKLRRKIEPNPSMPMFVLTVWGIGYKFSSEVM